MLRFGFLHIQNDALVVMGDTMAGLEVCVRSHLNIYSLIALLLIYVDTYKMYISLPKSATFSRGTTSETLLDSSPFSIVSANCSASH